MKDTVHAAVHRSVHLFGEGKFYGALRLRFTRPLILDKGKTAEWAGATPPLAALSRLNTLWGRSSGTIGCRQQKEPCCTAVSSKNPQDPVGKVRIAHYSLRFSNLFPPVTQES